MNPPIRAFVIDDEPLALRRLVRMLKATGRVEVAGEFTDPESAIGRLQSTRPDVLFLDIQMPRLTGFELLQRLESPPMVVFTTAYDAYAVRAFDVNSVDYLLKPIDAERLDRTLDKLEQARGAAWPPDVRRLIDDLARGLRPGERLTRLPSRVGDRTQFIDLAQVTHIYARDKLTYASTPTKDYAIDFTIADLERRLDADGFVRIHRSALVNLKFVHELDAWSGGGGMLRLNDPKKTELQVARDRVQLLRARLGM